GVEHMEVFLDELEHAETNVMVRTSEFGDALKKIVNEQLCLGTIDASAAAQRMETRGNDLLSETRLEATRVTGVVVPVVAAALLVLLATWLVVRVRRRIRGELIRPSRRENATGYLFILPWLVGLACFALGPILLALTTSFTDWNLFDAPRYVGAANYADALTSGSARSGEFWQSVKVTLIYALTAIPIQLVGGLLCAVLLNVRSVRFTGVFRTVLYLPYLFTGVAISIAWRWMYADTGVINQLLERVGIAGPDWLMSETWAMPAIVLMNFTWLGGNMIIFLAALQGVPPSLYDAAHVDGAGPFRRFLHVTLPMISPAVLFNLVMGTIWSFQVFAVPRIMTDGGPNDATLFYVLNLYKRAFQYSQMGYACALAVILFFIIFAVSAVELRGARRWVHYEAD
ncbi:MAG TPA: sugar ABC transporter permease, partial [Planctomycetota bacterium]|nr:sugar ABC transporter permease [Planctomycetota bacterium]